MESVLLERNGTLGRELHEMLKLKNGFYAFESTLHVFPIHGAQGAMTLDEWNEPNLWRHEYKTLADGMCFFSEDAFGNQFCIYDGRICSFDAETGDSKVIGKTFEDWAKRILADFEFLTGYPLAHEWQAQEGSLPIGMRLMPKIPFVLGGEYKVSNLYALRAVSVMRTCGNLARQIKDLPDGAQIEVRVIE